MKRLFVIELTRCYSFHKILNRCCLRDSLKHISMIVLFDNEKLLVSFPCSPFSFNLTQIRILFFYGRYYDSYSVV
jgi:hypothetical protein